MVRKRLNKYKKFILLIFAFVVYIFFLFYALFNLNLLNNFSSVSFNKDKLLYRASNVKVFDNKNKQIFPTLLETKNVAFSEIPQTVIDAFISIEDKNFYRHKGVNFKRIVKAMIKNISTFSLAEGASTISQQLIKNTHLTNQKTFKRKINEILLTKKMESKLSKNEILTAYLNAIYFGANTFGINSAAQRYFSKNVSELNLVESATLAGIIKSPKKYLPTTQKDNCLKRRNVVLREMLKDKKITKTEYEKAIKEDLNLNVNNNFLGENSYYASTINEALSILNITEKDLIINDYKIYTYQDEVLQKVLENEINNSKVISKSICESCDFDSLAILTDNNSGGIIGYFGKSDFTLLDIKRQPGSVLKPIISYAPAIEYNLINPLTPILDEQYVCGNYKPRNYKDKYYGWISAKDALAKSLNVPSVKILETVGIEKAKRFISNFDITLDELDNNLSIALGGLTRGLKVIDVTNCYQTFANNGKFIKARFIKEIRNANNQIIYKNGQKPKQIIKDSTAYLITDMLKNSVSNGTCKRLNNMKVEIAAKTGTVGINNSNNENSDLWNISYTPEKTLGIWCGVTTCKTYLNSKLTGGNLPTIIAKNIYENLPSKKTKFDMPNTIRNLKVSRIDLDNNKKLVLANSTIPERFTINGLFAVDSIPKEQSLLFNNSVETINLKLESIKDNCIKLSFECKNYLEYELIRETEDESKTLEIIKNKTGNFYYEDKNLPSNNFYNYYLKVKYASFLEKTIKNCFNKSNLINIYVA